MNTQGYACPNRQCLYFGNTDAQIHALVGDGKHGQAEPIQTFRCQACRTTFSARRDTPLYRLKTPSQKARHGPLSVGRGAGCFRRRTGRRATVSPPSPPGSLVQVGMLRSSMSAPSVISGSLTSSWTNCAPGCATPHRCCGSGWPWIPARRLFRCSVWVRAPNIWPTWFFTPCDRPWLLVASRSLPVTASITTSMRLSAHFGQWLTLACRGRHIRRWQVAPSLIYGQVKKSYRRRKLVRVSQVMRLGTEAALKAALQELGLSGRLNTAFIERVNLTVRHGVAALARRTWATSQQASQLLAHLEWWRAYYHGCRVLTNRCG
ncbi:MAG: hypothetical protein ACXVCM_07090 [Ktedonobacteraceae bacterium]